MPPTPPPPAAALRLLGDTQTLTGRSGSVSCGVTAPSSGSWCTQRCVCTLQASLVGMGLILNVTAPLLLSCCSFSFALGYGVSFLMDSNLLLSMVVQQWVAISQKTRAHLSTPPSLMLYYYIHIHIHIHIYIYIYTHSEILIGKRTWYCNNFTSDTWENPLHTHVEGQSDRTSMVKCYYLETLGEGYTGILCRIFAYSFISNFKMFFKMFSISMLFLCPHSELNNVPPPIHIHIDP